MGSKSTPVDDYAGECCCGLGPLNLQDSRIDGASGLAHTIGLQRCRPLGVSRGTLLSGVSANANRLVDGASASPCHAAATSDLAEALRPALESRSQMGRGVFARFKSTPVELGSGRLRRKMLLRP